MHYFLITSFSREISRIDLIGIIFGHIIFGIAITQILDWSWLQNLMSHEQKEKMLKSYNWKDLIVDSSIFLIFIGVSFLLISYFI